MKFCLAKWLEDKVTREYIYWKWKIIYKIKIIDYDSCKDRSKSYSENETFIFSYDELISDWYYINFFKDISYF